MTEKDKKKKKKKRKKKKKKTTYTQFKKYNRGLTYDLKGMSLTHFLLNRLGYIIYIVIIKVVLPGSEQIIGPIH